MLCFECIPWAQLGFCFGLDPLREESRFNEKKIIELYPKLPPNSSSFKYSINEEVLRIKIQCDVLIKDVKGDISWMKGEYKQKYNHIFQCINAWNTSLEKSSDEIKESVKTKEQEIKDKMDKEYWDSITPKFGLG